MQIADALLPHDVRDVGHPQLAGCSRAETRIQESRVLAVVVIGVRRMSSVQRLEDQMLYVHQAIEAVTANHDARTHVLKHQPKLVAPDAGAQAAKLVNQTEYLRLVQLTLLQLIKIVAVVSPATFPEQPADLLHAQAGKGLAEAYCCRVPAFFNMSTPSCSS